MKRSKLITYFLSCFIVLLVSTICLAQKNTPLPLTYQFSFKEQSTGMVMEVKFSFQSSPKGMTLLRLPNAYAGNRDLYRLVKDLKIENARISDTRHPFFKKLTHKPDAIVTGSYTIDLSGRDFNFPMYRPRIDKSHFYLLGPTFLVFPAVAPEAAIALQLNWALPNGWSIANSLGAHAKQQTIILTLNAFTQGLFLGGDYQLSKANIDKMEIVLAKRGDWDIAKDKLAREVKQVIQAQNAFWGKPKSNYLLISLEKVAHASETFGGIKMTRSLSLFMPEETIREDKFFGLIGHEYFHLWNSPSILKDRENAKAFYWLTEGFTEYYVHLLNLREGLVDLSAYVKNFNQDLIEYFSSPYQNISNLALQDKFWSALQAQKIPYYRGRILAHNWDARVRGESLNKNSLDHYVKDLLSGRKPEINKQKIVSKAKKHLGDYVLEDIDNYLEQGKMLVVHRQALGPCVEFGYAKVPQYDYEFDLPTSVIRQKIVTLKKDGQLYALGARENMPLLLFKSKKNEKGELHVKLTLQKQGQEILLTYQPKVLTLLNVPQFAIDKSQYPANKDFCLKRFAQAR